MDKRFATVMITSALLATIVATVFYRLAAAAPSAPSPQLVPVVCAAVTLPVGSKIGPKDIKVVNMPSSLRPRDSFSRAEDVVDRPVIATVLQEEPVLKQRLSERGSGAGLAPMIPVGFRAVSVRVNDVIGVAGYAQPGMRVDVLVTGHPADSSDTVTRTVLQNVVVLSAGQVLQAEPKGQAISATLVTLQTTPEQAEILTLASDGGHIQLVLRNSTDSSIQASTGAQLSSVYGEHTRPAKPQAISQGSVLQQRISRPEERQVPDQKETVEIIRGSHRSAEPLSSSSQTKNTASLRSEK